MHSFQVTLNHSTFQIMLTYMSARTNYPPGEKQRVTNKQTYQQWHRWFPGRASFSHLLLLSLLQSTQSSRRSNLTGSKLLLVMAAFSVQDDICLIDMDSAARWEFYHLKTKQSKICNKRHGFKVKKIYTSEKNESNFWCNISKIYKAKVKLVQCNPKNKFFKVSKSTNYYNKGNK